MTEWFGNLDPIVQGAIITTVGGIVVAIINNKRKKDKPASNNVSTEQTNNGSNNVNMGEQNQDGSGNVQNTYINCNIQPTPQTQENDDFEDRMDKYMREHTATKEDIDKLFTDDVITLDGGNAEGYGVEKIGDAVIVKMSNLAGGKTVLIGDQKTITEQILKEHDEEIEKALSKL